MLMADTGQILQITLLYLVLTVNPVSDNKNHQLKGY